MRRVREKERERERKRERESKEREKRRAKKCRGPGEAPMAVGQGGGQGIRGGRSLGDEKPAGSGGRQGAIAGGVGEGGSMAPSNGVQ